MDKDNLIKLVEKYIQKKSELEEKGGPSSDGNLFEEVLSLEEEILDNFGLPQIKKYQESLWKIHTPSDIEKVIEVLQELAIQYLSGDASSSISLIKRAKENFSNPYDILVQLGYKTHVYTLTIFKLYIENQVSEKELLSELDNSKELLGEIGKLMNFDKPEKEQLFIDLQNKGLKLLEKAINSEFWDEYNTYSFKVIDSHTHVYSEEVMDSLIEEMKINNIDASIVLYWPFKDGGELRSLIDYSKQFNNIYFVASLRITNNQNLKTDIDTIRQLAQNKEIVGVKLYPGYENFFLDDERCEEIYSLCNDTKIPVIFHCGDTWATYPKPEIKYTNPFNIEKFAVKYPKLKFLICHIGNPCWIQETKELIFKHDNIFADISGLLSGKKTNMLTSTMQV